MLNEESQISNYYLACGYTDMRRGIDGLVSIVQLNFGMRLESGSIFLFCGRKPDRMKGLYWDGDGFVLLYKRLANGRFQWPRNEEQVRKLEPRELRWLLEGLRIDQPKAIREVRQKAVF
jgi:transposase